MLTQENVTSKSYSDKIACLGFLCDLFKSYFTTNNKQIQKTILPILPPITKIAICA